VARLPAAASRDARRRVEDDLTVRGHLECVVIDLTDRPLVMALIDMRSRDDCRSLSGQSGNGWTRCRLGSVVRDSNGMWKARVFGFYAIAAALFGCKQKQYKHVALPFVFQSRPWCLAGDADRAC
jgi:hypothetical protein